MKDIGYIPATGVVEWKETYLFGTRKITWVLPSVKVTIPTLEQLEQQLDEQLRLGSVT